MYGTLISDLLEHFTNSECFIMCDVTYGACCIDDISAHLLNADLLVHYGLFFIIKNVIDEMLLN